MFDFDELDFEDLNELATKVQNEIYARKEAAKKREEKQLKDSVQFQFESMPKELVYKSDDEHSNNYQAYWHFYNFTLGTAKTDLNCDATVLINDCGELVYYKSSIFGFNNFVKDSIFCDELEKSNILNWMQLVDSVYSELVEE